MRVLPVVRLSAFVWRYHILDGINRAQSILIMIIFNRMETDGQLGELVKQLIGCKRMNKWMQP